MEEQKLKMWKKLLSVLLITTLLTFPVARATASDTSLSISHINEQVAVYGVEDSEKLYNIMVDTVKGIGQFAIIYSDNPDYMYEYTFCLPKTDDIFTNQSWNDLIDSCFVNQFKWNAVYLPNAVQISVPTHATNESNFLPQASDNNIAYFESWLEGEYGEEYGKFYLRSTTINGVLLRQYEQLQLLATKHYEYYVAITLSVIGFITGLLGLVASSGLIVTISAIAGAGGLLYAGTKVYEYTLRANWRRYVTALGGSYPYSMADKFIFHTAYVSSTTGGRMVDPESMEVLYFPSLTYYIGYLAQFNAAYEEYLRIGWQG